MTPETLYADAVDVTAFTQAVLQSIGLSTEHATTMAKCLVQADFRGVSSHGLARFEQYIIRAQGNHVNTKPNIKIRNVTPVVAQVDGDNGFGFVVASAAMEEAIRRAETYGIAIVTAKRSNHFGMAASYVLQAIEAGMMGLVFTNSSKTMAAFGSKEPLLGTSPIAVGLPSANEIPFILDMAPSVVAKGKIRAKALRGQEIPEGGAVDEEGQATTDPVAALKGLVLPIGGPKGSGLAMLMDIMAGVLSGAGFACGVGSWYTDSRAQDVGHCFIVLKPDAFLEPGEVRQRMDTFVHKVHTSTPAKGFPEVLLPGELEFRMTAKRQKEGIPVDSAQRLMLGRVAQSTGVSPLKYSQSGKSLH
ncbi:hypothetical protein M409DRAFT_69086 [Zasmidium cellare ATCC 36951]|uniref:Malate dehydrogenase n=1 Tax=Zasmidium cellare ATCC 36951 TaxID=1080233 RepID=A0A6A6C9D8_ZASCE|nr:uncharacterized protein M409DRAFT_69086 [Zasmidium cellare ATCC 36951]KAF2162502.1 hypothetical protein M409DRAFT_69086 [Zasmidium cellare ATCC 36951]